MQEKKQNISPIKQRILLFAESLGISKRDFYLRIGVSRGTLESKTGITEDILAKFIAAYQDISIVWLLTGEGDMIKRLPPEPPAAPFDAPDQSARTDKMLDIIDRQAAQIKEQAGQIGQLQNRINELTEQNHKLTMELINAPGESEKPKERRMESPGSAVRRP